MSGTEPKLSQFGPAFAWLIEKDVSSTRLASLFGTTAENIRVIAYRSRHEDREPDIENYRLNDPIAPDTPARLGVRAGPDEVVPTVGRGKKLDWLKFQIESAVARHSRDYTFLNGVRTLRHLAPRIGYAGDVRRIALLAQLHQHTAWFLVHAGQCVSAAREAGDARELWRIAYNESRHREYAERFIQAALIGSHAWLLERHPRQSLETLKIARDAAKSIGAPMGSDHFRQRGVALFQLREDERAAEAFRKSGEAMERLNEARIPAQVVMTGTRHINLLGSPNWEGANEVLATARQSFGQESLEASMALHWAVACGVSTDSPSAIEHALDLITAAPPPAAHFGHQLTIRRLLTITPELGLYAGLRRAWVRRTLYENAFRNR